MRIAPAFTVLATASSLLASPPSSARAAPGGTLTIDVGRIDAAAGGVVCVALFAKEDGFPSDGAKAVKSGCVAVSTGDPRGNLRFVFDDLPRGRYAGTFFHDVNVNGKLDTGLFGIPKEPFGFTRNPPIRIGAPKFDACAVSLGATDVESTIELQSL